MINEYQPQVGDIVNIRAQVKAVRLDGSTDLFNELGKCYHYLRGPHGGSLELVERPEPKIKVELTLAQLRLIYDHLPARYKELNNLIAETLYP